MRTLHLLLFAATTALVAGCLSGQTGSPACPAYGTCACHSAWNRDILRARVIAVHGDTAEVEVDEVLSPAASLVLVPGVRGSVRFTMGPVACGPSALPAPAAGDTVLVGLDDSNSEQLEAWLVPWTDPLDLGDRQVPIAEVRHFADQQLCEADLEPPPCDDTVEGHCAVSRKGASSRAAAIIAAAGALALARRLSRRAKP